MAFRSAVSPWSLSSLAWLAAEAAAVACSAESRMVSMIWPA